RFLNAFLTHASQTDAEILGFNPEEDDLQTFPETPTARLTSSLVSLLVPLLRAKDKMVRFRAAQIIAHMVTSLDSIDDDVFHMIRQGLLKRIRDKEPSVRVQAVMGLGRLAGNEAGDDNTDDTAIALLEKLIEIMQNDTSA